MKELIVSVLLILATCGKIYSQPIDAAYQQAYSTISDMLEGKELLSFKKAVFTTENAFWGNRMSYNAFDTTIQSLIPLIKASMKVNHLVNYHESDSLLVNKGGAIYTLLKDTINIRFSDNTLGVHYPFTYDFDDFFGKDDWTKMFVMKLLASGSGNCHSLPYLYKIFADELGVTNIWLSFAPNHIYIRNRCKKLGWFNTELTSGEYPVDAWLMASGFISIDAIRSGIYMDTLSNRQAVANCAFDLAKGYERKYNIYTDSFIVRCCDLTLKYHPNNINAIVYKAEVLKKIYLSCQKENPALASTVYSEMERLYVKALDLGYKEMPEKMYREWMQSVRQQKEKYSNKKVAEAVTKGK